MCARWSKSCILFTRSIISHFGGGKRSVLYKAPCGRSLRNMEEVHMYLRITKSEMTVDLFDFDYWVNCLAEFVIEKCNVHIPVRNKYCDSFNSVSSRLC